MSNSDHNWVLVLAAGDGSRLQALATDTNGVAIPKQFCAFSQHESMLLDAIYRGAPLVSPQQLMLVVAAQHRRWWQPMVQVLPEDNLVVQPQNRGTGNGILLPLLEILDRDPDATIVLLPADHFVSDETVLQRSIERAINALHRSPGCMVMLGITPEMLDPELGYIVPGFETGKGIYRVRRFVEKPNCSRAEQLIRQGAVWNSFILVANGMHLLQHYAWQFPEVVTAMIAAHQSQTVDGGQQLQRLYQNLPVIDFSRHLLNRAEPLLRMVRVPACHWSDLGTPQRVADCIASMNLASRRQRGLTSDRFAVLLDLVEAHYRLELPGWRKVHGSASYATADTALDAVQYQ